MPTYEYQCGQCGNTLESVQSFNDDPLTVCPDCGAEALKKKFGNVGVVFKGSGFYRNDSRNERRKQTAGSTPKSDSGSDTKKGTSTEASAGSPKSDNSTTKTSDKSATAKKKADSTS